MELVSIIVPLYNKEKCIEKCLNSISKQSYWNFECIIVNDGSTDSSELEVNKFITNDSRFILVNKENGGVSSARNEGLKKATGKYVVFIDSDDSVKEDYVKELVEPLTVNNCLLSICNEFIEKDFKINVNSLFDEMGNYYNYHYFNPPWGKGFVRENITNLFDTDFSLGEDLLFNIQYMIEISKENGMISFSKSSQYEYFVDDNSLSHNSNSKIIFNLYQLIVNIKQFNYMFNVKPMISIQSKSLFNHLLSLYLKDKKEYFSCISTISNLKDIDEITIFLKVLILCNKIKIDGLFIRFYTFIKKVAA